MSVGQVGTNNMWFNVSLVMVFADWVILDFPGQSLWHGEIHDGSYDGQSNPSVFPGLIFLAGESVYCIIYNRIRVLFVLPWSSIFRKSE